MTSLDRYLKIVSSDPSRMRPMPYPSRVVGRALLLGYLFHALPYSELKARLRAFGVDIRQSWRARLVSDPAVIRDLKFPLYAAVCSNSYPHDVEGVVKKAVDSGLAASDIPLVRLACTHSKLVPHFLNLVAEYSCLSHTQFNAMVSRVVSRSQRNIGRFAAAKMRFLANRGYTLDHSTADCVSTAYESLLFQYPCLESEVHAENLFKRTARHQGLKAISYYSAGTRSAFHSSAQEGDAQQCRMSRWEEYQDVEDNDGFEPVYSEVEDDDSDTPLQLYQLLRSQYLSQHDKEFLQLASGSRDAAFDSWLREKVGCGHDDLIEQPRRHGRLIRMTMDYLNYPARRLKRLQGLLSGDYKVDRNPVVYLPAILR